MDLRGIATIAPDQFIIAGGMEANQKVSNKTYLLTYWDGFIAGIPEEHLVAPPTIYPSPANSFITIEEETPGQLSIYTINGKEIIHTNYKKGQHLRIEVLPPGIYLIHFKGKNRTWISKIVVE